MHINHSSVFLSFGYFFKKLPPRLILPELDLKCILE
ncbi:Hypothetical protein Minf_0556 [Methylacidiphilum infernorum V4]|uniref:Uncharacterized protein n=1 Tax=Methylacidiphilum infernorum (isolate V4) TaxID=481448 RepID=B3DZJ7_METI4|nr:Hypothetical protein Minf_0556 [Methylacidiphilum infernorum V4]